MLARKYLVRLLDLVLVNSFPVTVRAMLVFSLSKSKAKSKIGDTIENIKDEKLKGRSIKIAIVSRFFFTFLHSIRRKNCSQSLQLKLPILGTFGKI